MQNLLDDGEAEAAASAAAKDTSLDFYREEHSVAQYGAAFGAVVACYQSDDVAYHLCSHEDDEDFILQIRLMNSFRAIYGAYPVANGD